MIFSEETATQCIKIPNNNRGEEGEGTGLSFAESVRKWQ